MPLTAVVLKRMETTHRAPTKGSSRRDDGRTVGKLGRLLSMPEQCDLAAWEEVPWVQCRVDNFRHAIVVGTLLDDQNDQVAICFGQTRGNDAAGKTSCETKGQ